MKLIGMSYHSDHRNGKTYSFDGASFTVINKSIFFFISNGSRAQVGVGHTMIYLHNIISVEYGIFLLCFPLSGPMISEVPSVTDLQ